MLARTLLWIALSLAAYGVAAAEPASPGEVTAALTMFYPGFTGSGPPPLNIDQSVAIGKDLDGAWYRADLLGSVDPDMVATMCARLPLRIATAPNEITIVQESKPAPVTFRYTYVGGSLYSEWVDIPALFARLGFDTMTDEAKRRQAELNVLRANSGFVVFVRPSANVLWLYSLAGGPRLFARCG